MTLLLKETTEARILRIADSLQPEIRRTFLDAVTVLKRQIPVGRITDLLEEGKLTGVLEALSEVELTPQQLGGINDAILQTVTLSAELTTAEFGLDFALVNERAVRYAREVGSRLIVEVGAETQRAIADIVSIGLREGVAPRQQAVLIREVVGLTRRDALAVDRFLKGAIESGMTRGRARDQADRMARRLLNRRAENIARTETIRASNMGTQFGWDAASDAGLLPPGTQKVWIATEDSRTCPICAVLDGNTVDLGGNFDVSVEATAFTIDGDEIRVTATRPMKRPSTTRTPPAHPSCRCTIGIEAVAREVQQAPPPPPPTWEDLGAKLPRDPARRELLRQGLDEAWGSLPPELRQRYSDLLKDYDKIEFKVATKSTKSVRQAGKVQRNVGRARLGETPPITTREFQLHLSRYDKTQWEPWVKEYNNLVIKAKAELGSEGFRSGAVKDVIDEWLKTHPEPSKWRLATPNELANTLIHELGHVADFAEQLPGTPIKPFGRFALPKEIREKVWEMKWGGPRGKAVPGPHHEAFAYATKDRAEMIAELHKFYLRGVDQGGVNLSASAWRLKYPELAAYVKGAIIDVA